MVNRRNETLALTFSLVLPTIITYLYFVLLAGAPARQQQTAYSIGKIIQFTFPLFWVWFVGRRVRDIEPAAVENEEVEMTAWKGTLVGLGVGLTLFVAAMALFRLVLEPFGVFESAGAVAAVRTRLDSLGLRSVGKFAAVGLFYSLIHSGLEEYYWRWFVFGRLQRVIPFRWALIISSVGFMAHHVLVLANYFRWDGPWTYIFSLAVMIGGLIWGALYRKSGSIIATWVSHALVDAAIFVIGYQLAFGY